MTSRLVLCLGDLFIPDRAADIPAKFKKLLVPGKISQILFLGNATTAPILSYLRTLAPDLHIVKGDFDIDNGGSSTTTTTLALSKVVTHGNLRVGFTHGHAIVPRRDGDALLIAARQMDVDVLFFGGCRGFEAWELEGRFFVGPGSATGAVDWGALPSLRGERGRKGEGGGGVREGDADAGGEEGSVPSFVLMDVQGDVVVFYVYQLKRGEDGTENVGVEKVQWRKGGGGGA